MNNARADSQGGQQLDPPMSIRLPLLGLPNNRAETPDKDSRIINAYVDKGDDGELYICKRPGLDESYSIGGAGRGCYMWKGDVYSVFGGNLYKGVTLIGAVDATNGKYTFSSTLGSIPKLFLNNGVAQYYYSTATGLVKILNSGGAAVVTSGNTTNGSPVITAIPSTAVLSLYSGITGAGIPANSTIVSIDSGTQITISANATATAAAVALTVTLAGPPTPLVKGSAFLDGTTYVADALAKVYGSDINDPSSWNPLNFILAYIEPDGAVFVDKQLVYVIVFKEWTIEVFNDAGNAAGSPLGRVQGAKVGQGCRTAELVQEIDDALFWVAQTRSGATSIWMMAGLKAEPISSPAIDRLLQDADFSNVASFSFKLAGHKFYVITLRLSNLSIVFDATMRQWSFWTDANGDYFPFVDATYTSDQQVLLQHESDGKMYEVSLNHLTDDGDLITVDIYPPEYDAGSRRKKTLRRMDIIGDQTPGSYLALRVNDSNYEPLKWTNFRIFDLSVKKPHIENCGTFRKRAFHFRHARPTRFRVRAVELDVMLGVL